MRLVHAVGVLGVTAATASATTIVSDVGIGVFVRVRLFLSEQYRSRNSRTDKQTAIKTVLLNDVNDPSWHLYMMISHILNP